MKRKLAKVSLIKESINTLENLNLLMILARDDTYDKKEEFRQEMWRCRCGETMNIQLRNGAQDIEHYKIVSEKAFEFIMINF